jgi:hypothetical protein
MSATTDVKLWAVRHNKSSSKPARAPDQGMRFGFWSPSLSCAESATTYKC